MGFVVVFARNVRDNFWVIFPDSEKMAHPNCLHLEDRKQCHVLKYIYMELRSLSYIAMLFKCQIKSLISQHRGTRCRTNESFGGIDVVSEVPRQELNNSLKNVINVFFLFFTNKVFESITILLQSFTILF